MIKKRLNPFMWPFPVVARNAFPAVVMQVEGKVEYSPAASGRFSRLEAGIFLNPESRLKLKKDASVILCYNQFARADKKGNYTLSELLAGINPDPQQQMDFNSIFYTYLVQAGVETSFKGYGDAFGGGGQRGSGDAFGGGGQRGSGDGFGGGGQRGSGDAFGGGGQRGSGDAWGKKQDNIIPIFPYGGKVSPAKTTFLWSAFPEAGHYEFKLVEASGGKVIHQESVRDAALELDLKELGIAPDVKYQWSVTPASDPSKASEQAGFTGGAALNAGENLQRIEKEEDYRKGDASTRLLMEAVAYEADEWYYLAYQKYQEALKGNPGNLLLRRMYATFLYRQGLKPLAVKVLE